MQGRCFSIISMDVLTIGPFILESSQALRAFQGSGTGFGPDQTHANMMLRRNKICRYHATTAVMTTAIAVSITTRSSTILHAPILVTLNNSVSSAGPSACFAMSHPAAEQQEKNYHHHCSSRLVQLRTHRFFLPRCSFLRFLFLRFSCRSYQSTHICCHPRYCCFLFFLPRCFPLHFLLCPASCVLPKQATGCHPHTWLKEYSLFILHFVWGHL